MKSEDAILDAEFILRPKAIPLPCSHRPIWRMSILLLLIEQCSRERATIEQLHVLNWAIRSSETRRQFLEFIRGFRLPSQVCVRRDPSLNRALEFASAEKLIAVEVSAANPSNAVLGDVRIRLDAKGGGLLHFIKGIDGCFAEQRRFLREIGRKITQKEVAALLKGV